MVDIFKIRLEPHYQPIISLMDGSVFGYESLIRGHHAEFHTPAELFNEAEKQNKKEKLDLLCFKKGLENAPAGVHTFLNLNACTLTSDIAEEVLKEFDLSRVVVEITEHERITNRWCFDVALGWLKSQGCSFAIDDLASGYDRLINLVEYETDYVKIDCVLIRDCDRNEKRQKLLKHLVDIAGIYGAKTIAEGIETEEELSTVKKLGFDFGQGFYFAKPLPVKKIL